MRVEASLWNQWWRDRVDGIAHWFGWQTPWIPADLADGNPVFTARSEKLNRGVRIIYREPADPSPVSCWHDTTLGGINELVFCAHADNRDFAQIEEIIQPWITGRPIRDPADDSRLIGAENLDHSREGYHTQELLPLQP